MQHESVTDVVGILANMERPNSQTWEVTALEVDQNTLILKTTVKCNILYVQDEIEGKL